MKIFMASGLDLFEPEKGADGSPQRRTVSHYLSCGDYVTFVTCAGNATSRSETGFKGLDFTRVSIGFLCRAASIRTLGWFARLLSWGVFQSLVAAEFIRRRRINYDVLYAYEIQSVPVLRALSALFRIPLVTRFQGTILRREMSALDRLRQCRHVLGISIRSDLTIMTNDGTQGDRLIQELRGEQEGVEFLVNGIDPQFFGVPAKSEVAMAGALIVYCCGRLVKWKNHNRCIEVVAEARRRGADVRLQVIGDGPERRRLELHAKALGVEDIVEFTGAISHAQMVRYIERADVYLSSYDHSNFGKTMMEAMAGARAIVTTDVGDTNTFVRDGQHGFVCRENDLTSMANALVRLAADRTLAAACGANARRSAREKFWSWEERLEYERNLVLRLATEAAAWARTSN